MEKQPDNHALFRSGPVRVHGRNENDFAYEFDKICLTESQAR